MAAIYSYGSLLQRTGERLENWPGKTFTQPDGCSIVLEALLGAAQLAFTEGISELKSRHLFDFFLLCGSVNPILLDQRFYATS
jgi:hypothetical protein